MSEVIRIQGKVAQAPQTAAPVALYAQREAVAAELAALEQAEQTRLNAENTAARKASELKQQLAEIDRQQAEASVSTLLREAAVTAENSPQAVKALFAELNAVADVLKAVKSHATVQMIFDHTTEVVREAVGAAVSGINTENWNTNTGLEVRRKGAAVINQVNPMPLTLNSSIKQWIAQAKSEHEKTARVGIALAVTGILFKDIPTGYSATAESADILRTEAIPGI